MNDAKSIGMDVHQATISVTVRDSRGNLMMEAILETKAETILQFIHGLRGSLHVAFEEGTWAAWLHDLLQPHVARVLVHMVLDSLSLPATCSEALFGGDMRAFGLGQRIDHSHSCMNTRECSKAEERSPIFPSRFPVVHSPVEHWLPQVEQLPTEWRQT